MKIVKLKLKKQMFFKFINELYLYNLIYNEIIIIKIGLNIFLNK